jgi:hypothetical protein
VLTYLLAHRDRVVLKQELLEHLWPDQFVGDAALNCYIMAVRQAIGDSGHTQRLIRTVRSRGYRFAGGGKGGAQGEHVTAYHAPDAGPGARVPGVDACTTGRPSGAVTTDDRPVPPPQGRLSARGVLRAHA